MQPLVLTGERRDGRDRPIIAQPKLGNPAENAARRAIPGEFRDYRRDTGYFAGFFDDVRCQLGLARPAELAQVRFFNTLQGPYSSTLGCGRARREYGCGLPSLRAWPGAQYERRSVAVGMGYVVSEVVSGCA